MPFPHTLPSQTTDDEVLIINGDGTIERASLKRDWGGAVPVICIRKGRYYRAMWCMSASEQRAVFVEDWSLGPPDVLADTVPG